MSQRTRLHANGPASRTGRLAGWALAAVLGVLPACRGAPVPIDRVPEVDAPKAFSDSGTGAPVDDWWTRFGDPRLDRHVERALESNRELESIWHAFREAAAVARGAGAAQRPMLDLFLDGTTIRSTEGSDVEQTAVGAALAYEVDLWGRLEADRRADVLEAWASLDDYHTAVVSLTAEVARTWYRLLEAELQVAVLDDQIVANEKILSLIEPRVAAQQLRSVDLLRQETLIESRREARIEAETDAQVLRNQLAVLTGRPPGGTEADEDPALADLPPLPADRRPDRERAPAPRREGGRLPRHGGRPGARRRPARPLPAPEPGGQTAGSAAGIFEGFVTRFAGGLLAPCSTEDAGPPRSTAPARNRDRLRAEYAQTILVAFREVEDALVDREPRAETARERRTASSISRSDPRHACATSTSTARAGTSTSSRR